MAFSADGVIVRIAWKNKELINFLLSVYQKKFSLAENLVTSS